MIMKSPESLSGSGYYESLDFEADDDVSSNVANDDFSEYLWMENEEEFDKMEMQRLEEEDIMKECIEAMFEDELEDELARVEIHRQTIPTIEKSIATSTLNPLAAEFIPTTSLVTSATN